MKSRDPRGLQDAAAALLLALLALRETEDGRHLGAALRDYALAGRREGVDRASLLHELAALYDAVFALDAGAADNDLRRQRYALILAACYHAPAG